MGIGAASDIALHPPTEVNYVALELSGERGTGIIFLGVVQLPGTGGSFEAGVAQFAAPSVSIFKYFSPSEDDVTKILRHLLDPKGDHGQGALFLGTFLAQVELGFPIPEPELGLATVRTQVQTVFNRRPDLLISVPGRLVLGLENKINAADLDTQVAAYVECVRKRSRGLNWAFAFLTPDGRAPSAQSISPQDRGT
jgi:hypothetical protein